MSTYAADWNELFFRQSGWFGGDGIFGIPLDGKEYVPAEPQTKTLFIFSDSVIGKTKDGKVKKGDFKMIHNLVALLEGKRIRRRKVFNSTGPRTKRAPPRRSLYLRRPTPYSANITGWATAL